MTREILSFLFANKARGIWIIFESAFLLAACSTPAPISALHSAETADAGQPVETLEIESPRPTPTLIAPIRESEDEAPLPTLTDNRSNGVFAEVLSVRTSGSENAYQFAVEIRSPDTGCEQYADWWEVINEEGELLYRRILTHSHVGEQPFTRSGGPAAISADMVVIVRAHMHPDGYGSAAFRGSVQAGFEEFQMDTDFATGLENIDPLPAGCDF